MKNENTIYTLAGNYTIVAKVYEEFEGENTINLYVGASIKDGHHDLIAEDNASWWAVGNPDDPEENAARWRTIGGRYDSSRDEIATIDSKLVDWLDERKADAECYKISE